MVKEDSITKVVEICKKYKPAKVLLFGSAATGPLAKARDIDIVVYRIRDNEVRLRLFTELYFDVQDSVGLLFDDDIRTYNLSAWEAQGRFLIEDSTVPLPAASPAIWRSFLVLPK